MKFIEDIGEDKLRGAFYTPPPMVEACISRLSSLTNTLGYLKILEPSAGDGAFIRGLQKFLRDVPMSSPDMTCVELLGSEAAQCERELARCGIEGEVVSGSFFEWAFNNTEIYDAVLGNPPFVRYQFVPDRDRMLAEIMLRAEGHDLQGVSNLWIPFVLLSLRRLRAGGAFAFVLPNELLSTISAGQVRHALLRDFDSIRVDSYPRGAFPDILQDVLIVSGVKTEKSALSRQVTFSEYRQGTLAEWHYQIPISNTGWTHYFLTSAQSEALALAECLTGFHRLGKVATIGVAIVTGANDFFTVDDSVVKEYQLGEWARPLLSRTADSPGIVFTQNDHESLQQQGKKAWLLDFASERPDPTCYEHAKRYLAKGEEMGLPSRYKCRIRSPWYRAPHIKQGALMMAKRCHQHHRLIINKPGVFTTDTIYRGEMKKEFETMADNLVSGIHNSVTLLSAEIEGRAYGGGVLELVPSEISRLLAPVVDTHPYLQRLDTISRNAGGQQDKEDTLINATDQLLCDLIPGYSEILPSISQARISLRDKRFKG